MPAAASARIPTEDQLRAQLYGFLGATLRGAPSPDALASMAALGGDDSEMGRAFAALAQIARDLSPAEVAEEYQALFIGLGRGELVPYASYYLTGFLNEKPLAALRATMAGLGIARADDVRDPEDHIGALCEMMAGLILGTYAPPAPLGTQAQMFTAHIAPFAAHFFKDLEAADNARFYRPLGRIGGLFMAIEQQAFEMD